MKCPYLSKANTSRVSFMSVEESVEGHSPGCLHWLPEGKGGGELQRLQGRLVFTVHFSNILTP